MRDLIGIAASVALPWIAGTLCIMAIRRGSGERDWLGAAGYGYLVGALVTTLVMRALGAVGIAWSPVAVALPMLAIAFAGYAAARPLPAPHVRWGPGPGSGDMLPASLRAVFWLCLALTAIRIAGLALEVAWRPLLPFDAWSQWATKARVWFEYGRIVAFVSPADWLRNGDPMAFMDMHWHYPGTVPLLQVWTSLAIGRWDESLINAPWPALAVALGMAFYSQARRASAGAPQAMLFTYFLLSLPFLDVHVALAGGADLFVAAAYAMATMALWQWTRARQRADLALAALMAGACCAIKIEGMFWALTLVPAVLVAVNRRVGFAAVGLLAASALGYLLFGPPDVKVWNYTLRTEFTNVSLPVLQHLFIMDNWHLLWYGALAAIMLRYRRLLQIDIAPMTVALAGALGFVAVVFYFSSASGGVDNESLVNRLPLHMVPALAFYVLLLLRPCRAAASRL